MNGAAPTFESRPRAGVALGAKPFTLGFLEAEPRPLLRLIPPPCEMGQDGKIPSCAGVALQAAGTRG